MFRTVLIAVLLAMMLSGCRQDESEPPEKPQGRVRIASPAAESPERARLPDWVLLAGLAIPVLVLAYAAVRLRKALEARNLVKVAEMAIAANCPKKRPTASAWGPRSSA